MWIRIREQNIETYTRSKVSDGQFRNGQKIAVPVKTAIANRALGMHIYLFTAL